MKLATRIFRREDWYVTSPFGERIDPIDSTKAFHNGCDYGTHVSKWAQYALEEGIVESAGKDSSGAIFAWIKYPRLGFRLLHYHLDSVAVKTGQSVDKNTLIGYTGTTGRSTGIHLHLGMRNIGSSTYIDAHSYNYEEYVAPVVITAPMKFNKGDKVIINGRLYANAAGTKAGKTVSNITTFITRVAPGTKCPYNTTGDLGWMEESSISLFTQPPTNVIVVGSIVVPITLRSYNGTRLVQYDKNYVVSEIVGDRVVLKANRNGKLVTWAAMNINNIRRV
jgi:murein DD-endopeptidase MepM/ murein hydrolase activator NlpD